jgi:hypothetical protein
MAALMTSIMTNLLLLCLLVFLVLLSDRQTRCAFVLPVFVCSQFKPLLCRCDLNVMTQQTVMGEDYSRVGFSLFTEEFPTAYLLKTSRKP